MNKVRMAYNRKTQTWFVQGVEFLSKLDAYRYANSLRTNKANA